MYTHEEVLSAPENTDEKKIVALFGNGLGRDFDNKGFATESILQHLFEDSSELKSEAKVFFAKLFQSGFPKSEEELGLLEEFNDALDVIENLSVEKADLFTNKSFKDEFTTNFKELKHKFIKYIYDTSIKVIRASESNGYGDFAEKLRAFIKDTSPTIATLNYDTLLYNAFLEDELFREIFTNKETGYTDGFLRKKTDSLPKFEGDFFFLAKTRKPYLHLHGAYFYTQKNTDIIEKQHKDYRPNPNDEPFVILTSQKKKIQRVFSSPKDLLRIYSGYFFEKLIEANHIIIFGYSGGDEYLNTNLRYAITKTRATETKCAATEQLRVTIICRSEQENGISDKELKNKWSKCLTGEEENICNFDVCNNPNYPLSKSIYPYEIRRFPRLTEFNWNWK